MLAVEVGVRVDHLRLEPQPELHAEAVHVVDEAAQPLRPHVLVDPPVAQPSGVVAASEEPAVVEDEPLHADLGRRGRRAAQPSPVVVEVDRLPHVQRDRLLARGGQAACAARCATRTPPGRARHREAVKTTHGIV